MDANEQWEIVRKNPKKSKQSVQNNDDNDSKRKKKSKDLTAEEARKYLEKMPRRKEMPILKDIKPSMFSILAEQEKQKPKKAESVVIEEEEPEPEQDSEPEKKPSTANGTRKKKTTNSLDEALNRVNLKEMRFMLDTLQLKFPLLSNGWLQDLASYLNHKLNVNVPDPLFSERKFDYPLGAASKEFKNILKETLNRCQQDAFPDFLELTFVEIANDVVRGININGYRVVLQALIEHNPSLILTNLDEFRRLLGSYQRRPAVFYIQLWLVGRAGVPRLDVGLKVWLEIMLPVVRTKEYSKCVLEYINNLLSWHQRLGSNSSKLDVYQFFSVFDTIFNNNSNLSGNFQKDVLTVITKLKSIAFSNNPRQTLRKYFPSFLTRLTRTCSSPLKAELLTCLVNCLKMDAHCFVLWRQLYPQHLVQSSLLLEHLVSHWKALDVATPLLKDILKDFNAANNQLAANLSKKSLNGLSQCATHCKIRSLLK